MDIRLSVLVSVCVKLEKRVRMYVGECVYVCVRERERVNKKESERKRAGEREKNRQRYTLFP